MPSGRDGPYPMHQSRLLIALALFAVSVCDPGPARADLADAGPELFRIFASGGKEIDPTGPDGILEPGLLSPPVDPEELDRPPLKMELLAGPFAPLEAAGVQRRRGLFARLFGLDDPRLPSLETRYPVVLAHGANTPKSIHLGPLHLRYFSRTEPHLRRLGLRLLVPSVDPFGSIEDRGKQLKEQVLAAIPEGKFNLVCHSMGGLDARWLATHGGLGDRIASITTVATPHHGAWYADFADEWIFEKQGLRKLLGLVGLHPNQLPDLAVRHVEGTFNPKTPNHPGTAYFSYGTWCNPFMSPPFYWGMNLITRISELRARSRPHGQRPAYGERTPIGLDGPRGQRIRLSEPAVAALERASDRGSHGWIDPEWAGRNDGVVSVSSSVWGQYLGTVRTHHWGPMGWLTGFKEERFWEEIVRRLSTQGF